MVADRGGERRGCLGSAGGMAELLGKVFGGSAGRKLWEVLNVGKCVGCEGVVRSVLAVYNLQKETYFHENEHDRRHIYVERRNRDNDN